IGRGFELAGLSGGDEVMLIGGAQLYASCFEYVSKMYVTEVDAMIEGDAHFPAILAPDWNLISETPYPQGPKDDFPFSVKEFERR
ncbi:MAG: dihydrofolate reductase, partial [Desulfobacterales bacterium]|nr:dihydrofolate reductase [Desulfobacterales bacterium]